MAREVVGGLEGTADAFSEGSISTVVGAENRVLESTGVLDVDIQLAILAGLGGGNAGAYGGNVGVEDECDNGPVARDLSTHGTLRATSSTISNTSDGDLLCVSKVL